MMQIYAVSSTHPRRTLGSLSEYKSLIWTERYSELGEFELKTLDVKNGRTQLPLESLVTIIPHEDEVRDITTTGGSYRPAVMYVETHSIETNDDGLMELTITGRGLEYFASNRVARRPEDSANSTWSVLADTGMPDALKFETVAGEMWGYWAFSDDNLSIYDESDFLRKFHTPFYDDQTNLASLAFSAKDIYSNIRALLGFANAGMKVVLSNAYDTEESAYSPQDHALLYIYKGGDLRSSIKFNVDTGIFKNAKYLTSVVDHKNVAYVFNNTAGKIVRVYASGTPSNVSGLQKKVLFVDGSNINITNAAQRDAAMKSLGEKELRKYRKQAFFDGQLITELSPYKYGNHYFLGNLVTVQSEIMGFSKVMRVAEYVRIQDENGYSAYPGLVEYG